GGYTRTAHGEIGFKIGSYDHSRALIIDPVLNFTAVAGGTGLDVAQGIAMDGQNNVYVAGYTSSTDFPTSTGAFRTASRGGGSDAFVFKLSPDGTTLLYSTILGGTGF